MKKIFYCDSCGSTFSDDEEKKPSCTKCGKMLTLTKFTIDEWRNFSPEEEDNAKGKMREAIHETSGNVLAESEIWKKDIHMIAEDVHFIRNVVLASVIITVICALVVIFLPSV